MNKIIKYALVLICAIVSMNANAVNKKSDIYAFGFSASFNDSIVYFTDIQLIPNATLEHKSHFLENRDLYSKQLNEYLSSTGDQTRICALFFGTKQKKVEKEFAKLRKKYAKHGLYDIKYISANDFHFKTVESDEEPQMDSPKKKMKPGKMKPGKMEPGKMEPGKMKPGNR